jgi:hypothetical protein
MRNDNNNPSSNPYCNTPSAYTEEGTLFADDNNSRRIDRGEVRNDGGIEVTDEESNNSPVFIETHGNGINAFRTRTFYVNGAKFVQVNDTTVGTTGWSAPVFVPTLDDVASSIQLGIQQAVEDIETRHGSTIIPDSNTKHKSPRKRTRRTTQKFTRKGR